MSPDLITRERARQTRHRDEAGYLFPLPYTGGEARVRRIPLARLATLTGLSSEMQATVLEVFREIQSGGSFAVRSWQDLERNQRRQEDLANGLAMAGFLTPRLVGSEAEADGLNDPSVLWVEEIDIRDRLAYLQTVMNPESEAAKQLAPFPPNGASDPESGQTLPPAAAPVGGAGVETRWSQPRDVPQL